MSFNKNTWSKDYTGAKGIKLLGAEAAKRKGFTPKYARKSSKEDGASSRTEAVGAASSS